jgi:hypothetical protein
VPRFEYRRGVNHKRRIAEKDLFGPEVSSKFFSFSCPLLNILTNKTRVFS